MHLVRVAVLIQKIGLSSQRWRARPDAALLFVLKVWSCLLGSRCRAHP